MAEALAQFSSGSAFPRALSSSIEQNNATTPRHEQEAMRCKKGEEDLEKIMTMTESQTTPTPTIDPADLDCAVCGDTFVDPRTLPCNHSYCLKCIYRLVNRDRSEGVAIKCPFNCHLTTATMDTPMMGDVKSLPRHEAFAAAAMDLRRRQRLGRRREEQHDQLLAKMAQVEADNDNPEEQPHEGANENVTPTTRSPPSSALNMASNTDAMPQKDDHCEWCGHECSPSNNASGGGGGGTTNDASVPKKPSTAADEASRNRNGEEASGGDDDETTSNTDGNHSDGDGPRLITSVRKSFFCRKCECTVCEVCAEEGSDWADHTYLCCDLHQNIDNPNMGVMSTSSSGAINDASLHAFLLSKIPQDATIYDFYLSPANAVDIACKAVADQIVHTKYNGELKMLSPPPSLSMNQQHAELTTASDMKNGSSVRSTAVPDQKKRKSCAVYPIWLEAGEVLFKCEATRAFGGNDAAAPSTSGGGGAEGIRNREHSNHQNDNGNNSVRRLYRQVYLSSQAARTLQRELQATAAANEGRKEKEEAATGTGTTHRQRHHPSERLMEQCLEQLGNQLNGELLSPTAPPFEARDLGLLAEVLRITETVMTSVFDPIRDLINTTARRLQVDFQSNDVPDFGFILSVSHTLRSLVKEGICPAIQRIVLIANALGGPYDERLMQIAAQVPHRAEGAKKILIVRAKQSLVANEMIQTRLAQMALFDDLLATSIFKASHRFEMLLCTRQACGLANSDDDDDEEEEDNKSDSEVTEPRVQQKRKFVSPNTPNSKRNKRKRSVIWECDSELEHEIGALPINNNNSSKKMNAAATQNSSSPPSTPSSAPPPHRPSLLDMAAVAKTLEGISVVVWDALCSLLQLIAKNLGAAIDVGGQKTFAERQAILFQESHVVSNMANFATCLGSLQQTMLTWKRTELSLFKANKVAEENHSGVERREKEQLTQDQQQQKKSSPTTRNSAIFAAARRANHLRIVAANHVTAKVQQELIENTKTARDENEEHIIALAASIGGLGPLVRLNLFSEITKSVGREPSEELKTFENLSRDFAKSLFPQMAAIRTQHLKMIETMENGGAARYRYLQEQLCALSLSSLDLFYRQSVLYVSALVAIEGEQLLRCTHALCDVMEQQAGLEPVVRGLSGGGINGSSGDDDASMRLDSLSRKLRAGGKGFTEANMPPAVLQTLKRLEAVQEVYTFHMKHLRGRYTTTTATTASPSTTIRQHHQYPIVSSRPLAYFASVFPRIGVCCGVPRGQATAVPTRKRRQNETTAEDPTRCGVGSSSNVNTCVNHSPPQCIPNMHIASPMGARVVDRLSAAVPTIITRGGVVRGGSYESYLLRMPQQVDKNKKKEDEEEERHQTTDGIQHQQQKNVNDGDGLDGDDDSYDHDDASPHITIHDAADKHQQYGNGNLYPQKRNDQAAAAAVHHHQYMRPNIMESLDVIKNRFLEDVLSHSFDGASGGEGNNNSTTRGGGLKIREKLLRNIKISVVADVAKTEAMMSRNLKKRSEQQHTEEEGGNGCVVVDDPSSPSSASPPLLASRIIKPSTGSEFSPTFEVASYPLVRRMLVPFYIGRVDLVDSMSREYDRHDHHEDVKRQVIFIVSAQTGELVLLVDRPIDHDNDHDDEDGSSPRRRKPLLRVPPSIARSLASAVHVTSRVLNSRLFFIAFNLSVYGTMKLTKWLEKNRGGGGGGQQLTQ